MREYQNAIDGRITMHSTVNISSYIIFRMQLTPSQLQWHPLLSKRGSYNALINKCPYLLYHYQNIVLENIKSPSTVCGVGQRIKASCR